MKILMANEFKNSDIDERHNIELFQLYDRPGIIKTLKLRRII